MHRLLLGALAVAILSSDSVQVAGQPQSGKINWLTDRKKAFDDAKKTGKPLWVLFR